MGPHGYACCYTGILILKGPGQDFERGLFSKKISQRFFLSNRFSQSNPDPLATPTPTPWRRPPRPPGDAHRDAHPDPLATPTPTPGDAHATDCFNLVTLPFWNPISVNHSLRYHSPHRIWGRLLIIMIWTKKTTLPTLFYRGQNFIRFRK
jgi:hypothetical protein